MKMIHKKALGALGLAAHTAWLVISGAMALLMVLVLVPCLALSPLIASATTLDTLDTVDQQSAASVTIPPGAVATMIVRGFCLDFGKPFPTQEMTTKGLADDKVRSALNYSIQKGYTNGNPQQVEQAIWFLRDTIWHNQADHAVGQEIVNNATTANAPPTNGDGITLSDAVTQNKVTLTAKFVAQTADHFYGDATIQLKNTGSSELKVFMPVGTVFTVPSGGGKFQDLAAYVLGAQSQQPTQQPTTAPTAQPTSTPQPTQQPTQQPTVTQVSQPTATTDPSLRALPTAAPATAMPTQSSGNLPQTGSAAGNEGVGNLILYVLAAFGLMLIGAWLASWFGKRSDHQR